MVAHWTFDNVAGSTIKDELGTYNLTASGITYATGKHGKGAVFKGGQYADSRFKFPSTKSAFTVACWAKVSKDQQNVMICGNSQSSGYHGMYLEYYDNCYDITVTNGSTYAAATNTKPTTDGKWHHIAATFTGVAGEGAVKLYTDGVLTAEDYCSFGNMGTNDYTLTIGSAFNNYFLNGTLDDFYIYNRALNPYEISLLAEV